MDEITVKILDKLYPDYLTGRNVELTPLLSSFGLSSWEIHTRLTLLQEDKLALFTDFYSLGSLSQGRETTLSDIRVFGRLLIDGKKLMDEHHKINQQSATYHADNMVVNSGTINGNLSQADNQSLLLPHDNATKTPPAAAHAIIIQILIGLFVTVIGGLIIWYLTTIF